MRTLSGKDREELMLRVVAKRAGGRTQGVTEAMQVGCAPLRHHAGSRAHRSGRNRGVPVPLKLLFDVFREDPLDGLEGIGFCLPLTSRVAF